MIKSMTGYGHSRIKWKDLSFFVEIRSINSRFLDINLKTPEMFSDLEDKIKKLVKDTVKRGHVNLRIKEEGSQPEDIEVDVARAKKYLKILKTLKTELKLTGEVGLDLLMGLPQVLRFREREDISAKLWPSLKEGISNAMEALTKSRLNEGESMHKDFMKHLSIVSGCLKDIEKEAPLTVKMQKEKLERNLKEFLPEMDLNHPRVAEELTLFATRVDITEEITRLKSHLDYFVQTLEGEASVGRRLDFIVQEMNREANTLASKSNNFPISSQGIIIKEEIEKMREQIQNVE